MSKDYTVLVQEVLVALRGKYSQEQLNRKLKFNTNQIARWESGHARIEWDSFVRLCDAVRAPLSEAILQHLIVKDNNLDRAVLLEHLLASSSNKDISKKLDVSIATLSRLKAGQSPLYLDLFFRIVDCSSYGLERFIAAFTPVPPKSIELKLRQIEKEIKYHQEYPWIAALVLLLATVEYKALPEHNDQYLSTILNVPLEELTHVMVKLEAIDLLYRGNGKVYARNSYLSTVGNSEGDRNIRSYWLNFCLNKAKDGPIGFSSNNIFGYKVLNISDEGLKELHNLYFNFWSQMDEAIKRDQSARQSERVALFNFQLIPLNNAAKK